MGNIFKTKYFDIQTNLKEKRFLYAIFNNILVKHGGSMKKITIITDTICDIPIIELEKKNIKYVPILVEINGITYKDKIDITNREFYEMISDKSTYPKTAQISPGAFEDIFKEELAKGNEIICITISSGLSGTYNSAHIAKTLLDSKDIHIIDSCSATMGQGALVLRAAKMLEDGCVDVSDIISELNHMIKKQESLIVLENMEMLKRGGRIPSSVATIGGFLNIKPTLTFKSGKLEMLGKCRGFKAAVKQAVSKICSSDIDTQYPITVAHANNLEACLDFINQLNEKIPSLKIETSEVGPAIGSHSGEGALAIFYQTK